ncbi:MAG: hypothetical protein GY822_01715 [Deltaproteobacteria bacterium]|nr:hypothetical protein [Deltaproteobacteria bacterium]
MPSFAASQALSKCEAIERSFDLEIERSFDLDAVLIECSAAAADTRLPSSERKVFLRMLGIAHASRGEENKAEQWFLQLLVLDPAFEMSASQSPRLLATIKDAKAKFLDEGKVLLSHTPPSTNQASRAENTSTQPKATKLKMSLLDALSQVVRAEACKS